MTRTDELLLTSIAERDPNAFAAALVIDRDNEQLLEALELLPDHLAGRVLARLPQSRLRALVTSDAALLGRRLEAVDFETALHLSARLPRDHALTLVRALQDQRLRRRLLRFLRFPEHSVGGLTPTIAVQLSQHAPVEQILGELGALGARSEPPVVILDDERRYLGKLDLWKLVTDSSGSGKASDYLLPAPGLHPETPLASCRQLRVWDVHGWLALVTHERRVLGAISRKQVFARADRAGAGRVPQASSLELVSEALVRVCGDLLTRLLGTRSR